MLLRHQGMSCHHNKKEAMFLSALILQETTLLKMQSKKQDETRYIPDHSRSFRTSQDTFQEKLLSRPNVHKATTVINAKTGNPDGMVLWLEKSWAPWAPTNHFFPHKILRHSAEWQFKHSFCGLLWVNAEHGRSRSTRPSLNHWNLHIDIGISSGLRSSGYGFPFTFMQTATSEDTSQLPPKNVYIYIIYIYIIECFWKLLVKLICVLRWHCFAWLWDFSQTLRKTHKALRELSPPSAGKAWAKKIWKTSLKSPESMIAWSKRRKSCDFVSAALNWQVLHESLRRQVTTSI